MSKDNKQFTNRDLRDIVLRFGAGHYVIADVENNRYEIPDVSQ
jgi:hypothetical protein